MTHRLALALATCAGLKNPDWRHYCRRDCERIRLRGIQEICRYQRDHEAGKKVPTEKRFLKQGEEHGR